jgi:pyruvate, water dikinase
METNAISSGISALDQVIKGLRLGDNVVWQVDRLDNYLAFARPFAERALADARRLLYLRFAPHPRVLAPAPGLVTIEVAPGNGFDAFSSQVHRIIEEQGAGAFYIFDSLSALVEDWATDELLANFFQVTCPFLRELDTVAYFALSRGRHSHRVVARIRDTTQLLLDVYSAGEKLYLHPIKVFDRYSSQMFLPHVVSHGALVPIVQSGRASEASLAAGPSPLRPRAGSIAPWDSVHRRLMQYGEADLTSPERAPEIAALKQELSRMLIGHHPEFNRLADDYLTLEDLMSIRGRLIGSGRIGGKAAGMILARRILLAESGAVDFKRVLEEHDSFYLGSDVFFTFLVDNDLFRMRLRLTRDINHAEEDFAEVERRFLEGVFPDEILEQFRALLDYFGQAPIIVRSSSLLEDSFGNSFAGKYRSEFRVNQGNPEERMEAFLRAVKLVYASALNPDALSYRRRRGLADSDEQMAILVQRVSGTRYHDSFFPPLAGVAFSHNLYQWTDKIDPEQGMIRLVFGLGTRAVNRAGADYPRMIAVSHPLLRPEIGARIARYSQRRIDLLDLRNNEFSSQALAEIVGPDYPGLGYFMSIMEEGMVKDPVGDSLGEIKNAVPTFNNLIARTDFIKIMKELLAVLERAYQYPIDTEFTAFVDGRGKVRVNLLQCRPLRLAGDSAEVKLPENLAPERVLFRAERTIFGGVVSGIRYIIYLDPRAYADQASREVKKSLGRVVGRLNRHPLLAEAKFILMGPGRWGSSNIDLGVNASYADLNHASVLVELAREEAGHVPDVSYGTHFFQDLVEARIIYLPVYPDDPAAEFNRAFFDAAPNRLPDLLPDAAAFADFIKVIEVPASAPGQSALAAADPRSHRAVCYLD